jgi:hypothetical protein
LLVLLGAIELINLIVAIMRFLPALLPEVVTEAQLVPIRSQTAAGSCSGERLVRCFWLLGFGWRFSPPERKHQCTAIRYLPDKLQRHRFVKGRSGVRRGWRNT